MSNTQQNALFGSRFLGVGSFVPPRVVTNDDLSKLMDTSDEWITTRSGIKQRHWVEGMTTTSDLALEASKQALEQAQITAKDLDCIVFATLSPDHEFPGTGCFLQAKLGVPGIPAIDIRQQCTGFVYGVSIADQFIKTGMYKKVLVVGAEVHSKGLNLTTEGRDVSVLFGDGAGAVVLGATSGDDPRRVLSTHLHSDGSFAKELWTPGPGMAMGERRWSAEQFEGGEHFPVMNGKTVFMHATRRMPEAVMEGLNANGLKVSDVDLFLFHQANMRINEMVAKQLEIPTEKVFNTIDRFGNTTAATLPIGMSEAIKAGVLRPGMLVASAAFGSGFTWGSAVFRF